MPNYQACNCGEPNYGKWCIQVDGVCDCSLGIFGSQDETETEIKRLILRAKVRAIAPHAQFKIPEPAQIAEYSGIIVAVIDPSEGFDHGIAQSIGRSDYALHTEKAFAGAKLQNTSVTIKYRDSTIKIEATKIKDRDGHKR